MHILMSRTMRQYVAYYLPHHITQYKVSILRTCTGAELFQFWTNPRDVMCLLISNDLTILKHSHAWPTQSLKLSRVQVYRVTIFPIRLIMGLCANTRCLQGASFMIIFFISNLLYSCAFFFHHTHQWWFLIAGHPATTVYGKFRRGYLRKAASFMRSGYMARSCRGRLSIGNFQGHTPSVCTALRPVTSHVQNNCIIQHNHISNSHHPFLVCSSRRTCLFDAAHYSRPIIL